MAHGPRPPRKCYGLAALVVLRRRPFAKGSPGWCGRARPVAVTICHGKWSSAGIRGLTPAGGRSVVLARLRECPVCGLLQRLPPLPRGVVALCSRCGTVLRRRRVDPVRRSLALALTGLLLFALAVALPFLDVSVIGRERETLLLSGPLELQHYGVWELAIAVLVTSVGAPLARLLALTYVLLGMLLPHPPQHLYAVFRWFEWLRSWSMIEVFLLGTLVAYMRLTLIAQVDLGGAVYALAGVMLAMAAADGVLDRDAVWKTLERKGVLAGWTEEPTHRDSSRLIGCNSCGQVSRARVACPRCGAVMRPRKTYSVQRTWALLIAAAILYIPANTMPMMTLMRIGHSGTPSTLLSGVQDMATSGFWSLAVLVFFASFLVPLFKLLGLSALLITTQRGTRDLLRERTLIYRIVDSIGRWSMIDVFMISIITATARMGRLGSVFPGFGAVAFCAVVVLTMLAAHSFDPRLIWDAAVRQKPSAQATP
jgi:paraquat-inducible protein A